MPHPISDQDFTPEVLASSLPVLLDFWAPWCGPCKAMLPVLEEVEKAYEGKLKVLKMNVDENLDVPGQFNVMSIPTFIFFKNGKAVSSFVGGRSKEDVIKEVEKVLAA
jgi:thioredoxin 1